MTEHSRPTHTCQDPGTPTVRRTQQNATASLGQAKNSLLELRDCYHGLAPRGTIERLTQGLDCAVEVLEMLPIPPEVQRG